MTLDPSIAALLKSMAHLPKLADIPLDAARKGFRARCALLPPATEPLASVENLTLTYDIPARLYRPLGQAKPALLLFFHGGGFVLGDLDTHDGLCRRLCARSRSMVLAVDYRLAPEHPYPAAMDDAWAALLWAVENAQVLGVDPDRLALAGDSAGGNLAAALALRCRDQHGPRLRAQALIYPVVDHYSTGTSSYTEMASGYGFTRESSMFYMDHYLGAAMPRNDAYALPLRASSHAGLPPTLIITAEYDVLRDEAETYAAVLTAAGVNVQSTRYAGMNHGFIALSGLVESADRAITQVCQWLRGNLTSHP